MDVDRCTLTREWGKLGEQGFLFAILDSDSVKVSISVQVQVIDCIGKLASHFRKHPLIIKTVDNSINTQNMMITQNGHGQIRPRPRVEWEKMSQSCTFRNPNWSKMPNTRRESKAPQWLSLGHLDRRQEKMTITTCTRECTWDAQAPSEKKKDYVQ